MENIKILGLDLLISRLIKYWFPVFVCMAIIFYASSLTGKSIPGLFKFQDIVFHFAAYFILSFFLSRALKNAHPGISVFRLVALTTILVIFYGVSDEFHQSFVPGRCVSGLDVFIDSLGGFFGGLLYQWRK